MGTSELAADAVTDAKINSTAFATLDQAATGTDQAKIINSKTLADLRLRLEAQYILTGYTAAASGSNMSAGTFYADSGSNYVYIQPANASARTALTARAISGQRVTLENGYGNIASGLISAVSGGDGSTRFRFTLATPNEFAGTLGAGTRIYIEGESAYESRTRELADGLVVARNIRDNAVGADALNVSGNGTSGQVLTSDGDGSFSWTAKGGGGPGGTPADGSITTAKLADEAVTTAKIDDGAVTAAKITLSGGGGDSGALHILGYQGSGSNQPAGNLSLVAGTNVGFSKSGDVITINAVPSTPKLRHGLPEYPQRREHSVFGPGAEFQRRLLHLDHAQRGRLHHIRVGSAGRRWHKFNHGHEPASLQGSAGSGHGRNRAYGGLQDRK